MNPILHPPPLKSGPSVAVGDKGRAIRSEAINTPRKWASDFEQTVRAKFASAESASQVCVSPLSAAVAHALDVGSVVLSESRDGLIFPGVVLGSRVDEDGSSAVNLLTFASPASIGGPGWPRPAYFSAGKSGKIHPLQEVDVTEGYVYFSRAESAPGDIDGARRLDPLAARTLRDVVLRTVDADSTNPAVRDGKDGDAPDAPHAPTGGAWFPELSGVPITGNGIYAISLLSSIGLHGPTLRGEEISGHVSSGLTKAFSTTSGLPVMQTDLASQALLEALDQGSVVLLRHDGATASAEDYFPSIFLGLKYEDASSSAAGGRVVAEFLTLACPDSLRSGEQLPGEPWSGLVPRLCVVRPGTTAMCFAASDKQLPSDALAGVEPVADGFVARIRERYCGHSAADAALRVFPRKPQAISDGKTHADDRRGAGDEASPATAAALSVPGEGQGVAGPTTGTSTARPMRHQGRVLYWQHGEVRNGVSGGVVAAPAHIASSIGATVIRSLDTQTSTYDALLWVPGLALEPVASRAQPATGARETKAAASDAPATEASETIGHTGMTTAAAMSSTTSRPHETQAADATSSASAERMLETMMDALERLKPHLLREAQEQR